MLFKHCLYLRSLKPKCFQTLKILFVNLVGNILRYVGSCSRVSDASQTHHAREYLILVHLTLEIIDIAFRFSKKSAMTEYA